MGRAKRRAAFQAVSSLSHQATRPGDTGTGAGKSPVFCILQAVVRLMPAIALTLTQGRSRSSRPPVSTGSPSSRKVIAQFPDRQRGRVEDASLQAFHPGPAAPAR